jgi:hypothetical protein
MAKGDLFGKLHALPIAGPRVGKGSGKPRRHHREPAAACPCAGLMTQAELHDYAGRAPASGCRPAYDVTGQRHAAGQNPPGGPGRTTRRSVSGLR